MTTLQNIDYTDILWMPLDLPKFNRCDELIEDFDIQFVHHTATAFEVQRLLEANPNYGISKPRTDLTSSQFAMLDYCNEYLPFSDLVNIKIHHMHMQGGMHIDFNEPKNNMELYKHNKENEPCGYRMVIGGTKQGDLAVINNEQEIIPSLPDDTDWYVISHTGTVHGNTRYVDDRYILFCHGWMDKEKNEELLSRSLIKYNNSVIYI